MSTPASFYNNRTHCSIHYEHAHVMRVTRGRLVNESTAEYQDFTEQVYIVFERTVTGRVSGKDSTPKDQPFGIGPFYNIDLGGESYRVSQEFYDRVSIGPIVRLTLFGCTARTTECSVGKQELLSSLPLSRGQHATIARRGDWLTF